MNDACLQQKSLFIYDSLTRAVAVC